jgi:hypothetical protein
MDLDSDGLKLGLIQADLQLIGPAGLRLRRFRVEERMRYDNLARTRTEVMQPETPVLVDSRQGALTNFTSGFGLRDCMMQRYSIHIQ